MMDGMNGHFMPFVNGARLANARFAMRDGNVIAHERTGLPQKAGIEIEGALQSVLIQYLDQSFVLQNAVVVTERDGLEFTFEHGHTSMII